MSQPRRSPWLGKGRGLDPSVVGESVFLDFVLVEPRLETTVTNEDGTTKRGAVRHPDPYFVIDRDITYSGDIEKDSAFVCTIVRVDQMEPNLCFGVLFDECREFPPECSVPATCV